MLERVKARGMVRCGSVERPGLAQPGAQGWSGLEVDVCRAIAVATLGSADRFDYRAYEAPRSFDALRAGQDDVSFLSGSEVSEHKLAGHVLPVATVFIESHAVMVPAKAREQHVSDLTGSRICAMIGSSSERSLENYFENLQKPWFRQPFSEDGEMQDAYKVQLCRGLAGELTSLAKIALEPGINRLSSRILPEPLEVFPIVATTGTSDAKWAAIVAWTVHTLVSAERPETKWYAGGIKAMPLEAPELSLDNDWQRRVTTAVGNYGELFERNLGKGSPLKLERGLNANRLNGGLMLSPFLD